MLLHYWCDTCQHDRDGEDERMDERGNIVCAVCSTELNTYSAAEERTCKSCGDTYEYDILSDPKKKAELCGTCLE